MSMYEALWLSLIIVFGFVIAIWLPLRILKDLRIWNKGVCIRSHKPWVKFASTPHGSRGYTDGAGEYCWIFFPVDKEVKQK